MSTEIAPIPQRTKLSALSVMAERLQVDPQKLLETLKATVFKNATNEELLALVVVANAYGLNPLTKEVYAFAGKSGGIVPVISIDGWANLANSHPQMDGIDFEWDHGKDGKLVSCTAVIYRKDRSRPTRVTEYLAECRRNTEPWKMEHRMLRHKALSQGVRIAFGFSGVYDEDEARDIANRVERDITPKTAPVPAALRDVSDAAPVQPAKAQAEPNVIITTFPPQTEHVQFNESTSTAELAAMPDAWDEPDQVEPETPQKEAQTEPFPPEKAKTVAAPEKWQDVVIHLGEKTMGKKLGEISPKTLGWFQKDWRMAAEKSIEEGKPLSDDDTALLAALKKSIQPSNFNK